MLQNISARIRYFSKALLFSLCAACAVAVILQSLAYVRAQNPQHRYLVISTADPDHDPLALATSVTDGFVTYQRPTTDLAMSLLSTVGVPLREVERYGWILISRDAENNLTYSFERTELAFAIERGKDSKQARNLPFIPLAILVGIMTGSFIKLRTPLIYFGTVVILMLAVMKLVTSCVSCGELNPASIAAVLVYGSWTLYWIVRPITAKSLVWLYATCIAGMGVQVFLVYTASNQSCQICAGLGFSQGLMASSLALGAAAYDCGTQPARIYRLGIASGALFAAWIPLLIGPTANPSGVPGASRGSLSVLGRRVTELGLKEPAVKDRRILVLFAQGCPPCQDAKAFFAKNPLLKASWVDVDSGGLNQGDLRRFLSGTPTLLFIEDGVVSDELVGWSSDEWWTTAITARINRFYSGSGPKDRKEMEL